MNTYKPITTDWDYQATLARRHRYMSPSLGTFTAFSKPVVLKRARMQYVYDENDRKYLDCLAQNLCISVGHCHPLVNREAKKQIDEMVHCTTMYYQAVPAHFAEELVATMPAGEDWVVHFVNSGAEANDLALLMARLYTHNYEILSLRNSFHGLQGPAMTMTGIKTCRQSIPSDGGVVHVHNPDQYRGVFGATVDPYVNEIDITINSSTPGQVAGFIVEPIQGFGGVIPMPDTYLAKAFAQVRAAGGVCIVDEVQTGFGRMGSHMWGFESHGVTPDIVVMAKGIGNGYPLAAVVAKREIAEAMAKKKFFNTYGSNPVSCAAGRAVLRVIADDDLMGNVIEAGDLLESRMIALKEKYSFIGDFRGRGLMRGIEFVKDRTTRESAPEEAAMVAELNKDNGLIVGRGGVHGNIIRINPPICATKDDMQFAAEVIEHSCSRI
ncbi:aspartate aminotransferase family protein [Desulforhopalus singaporensis]|uniref:Taurine--pyruvate aminotransferase n=1 Tax=Desulforhopalus singaporensis TaxID=91360 RepID=A0A1H0IYF7_9BACT|nr:aspartate aminotransferase family protein [Desulforhopalus singaporensis]SDO36534.1 alanine-glyoxylate transaminase / (R)-3-amino-2-methylpropionate-pyruvate transaminase [Desulforhopalus singaporensis]